MNIKGFVPNLLLVIITGIITWGIAYYQYKQTTEKKYFEYYFDPNPNFLSKPNLSGKKVAFFMDEKPIENLSQLRVTIYNFSDKDFENIPIYFELSNKNGDSIKLVNASAFREDGITDGIKEKIEINPSNIKGAVKKRYDISNLSRKNEWKTSFTIDFFFEGKSVPECKVYTDQTNAEARKLDISKFDFSAWYESIYFVVGCLLIIAIFAFYRDRIDTVKRNKEIIDFTAKHLENDKHLTLISSNLEIAKETFFLRELYLWEKTNRLYKRIFKNREPKRDDDIAK
jgi:hypothetical protein